MSIKKFTTSNSVVSYCIEQLLLAAHQTSHPWHWPTLVTLQEARVVVLRDFIAGSTVRFFTDRRSAKVEELSMTQGACSILLSNAHDRTQLRCRGKATELVDTGERQLLWDNTALASKRSYATLEAPGTALDEGNSGLSADWEANKPTALSLAKAFKNFAVFDVSLGDCDFLVLSAEGQQRAQFQLANDHKFSWVTP